MNVIKTCLIPFVFLLTFSCHAATEVQFRWKPNGIITNSSGRSVKLNIQSIESGKVHDNNLYVTGFQIDKEGINHPVLARVTADLKDINYWNFDAILKDIFIYQSAVHVNDSTGNVYTIANASREKTTIILKPRSTVIASDNDIIACVPSSVLESVREIGECYSVTMGWSVAVNWVDVRPKLCTKHLVVFEDFNKKPLVRKITINDGKISETIPVKAPIKNLCIFD